MRKLKLEELERVTIDTFKQQEKLPLVVILDSVRSMHNIGSIFRTSDGFSIEKIILCGITATPPHREIEKTALGATQSVAWEFHASITDYILQIKKEGYEVLAVEQAAESTYLHQFKINAAKKYALIFGNEVHGVSDEAMQLVDGCIEIPQFGTKHSFNITISVGIILWEMYAKMKLL